MDCTVLSLLPLAAHGHDHVVNGITHCVRHTAVFRAEKSSKLCDFANLAKFILAIMEFYQSTLYLRRTVSDPSEASIALFFQPGMQRKYMW